MKAPSTVAWGLDDIFSGSPDQAPELEAMILRMPVGGATTVLSRRVRLAELARTVEAGAPEAEQRER